MPDITTAGEDSVIIREAVLQDMDALAGLLIQLFSIETDFNIDEPKHRRGLAMMLEDNDSRCVMVAEQNGRVIGMCTVQLVVSTAEGGLSGLVEDVVVDSDCRGKGIGRRLLRAIEKRAVSKGALRLQLLADKTNPPALSFYEKMNWKQTKMICLRRNRD